MSKKTKYQRMSSMSANASTVHYQTLYSVNEHSFILEHANAAD